MRLSLPSRLLFHAGVGSLAVLVGLGVAHSLLTGGRLPSLAPEPGPYIQGLLESGDKRTALQELHRASQYLDDPGNLARMLQVARQEQDLDYQVLGLRALIERGHKTDVSVYNNLCRLLLERAGAGLRAGPSALDAARRNDLLDVIAYGERVRARSPADAVARFHLGLARLHLGEESAAIEHLQEAVRLDPALQPARVALNAATARSRGRP